eukprot:scaffold1220_cov259-Pinguiococcus_pyrenoidosus.AAC.21
MNNAVLQCYMLSSKSTRYMGEHLRTFGSEVALSSLFKSSQALYFCSPALVSAVIDRVAQGDAGLLDLLTSVLPREEDAKMTEREKGAEAMAEYSARRVETQSLIADELVKTVQIGAVKESLVEYALKPDSDADTDLQVALVSLLARACSSNPRNTEKVKEAGSLSLNDIMDRANRIQESTPGFVTYARQMMPWVQMMAMISPAEPKRRLRIRSLSAEDQQLLRFDQRLADDVVRYNTAVSVARSSASINEEGEAFRSRVARFSQGCGSPDMEQYQNNTSALWFVRLPGAKRIHVAFDPRTRTEESYDYVHVCKWPPVLEVDDARCHKFKLKQGMKVYDGPVNNLEKATIPGDTTILVSAEMVWASAVGEQLEYLPKGDPDAYGSYRMKVLDPPEYRENWIEWKVWHPSSRERRRQSFGSSRAFRSLFVSPL